MYSSWKLFLQVQGLQIYNDVHVSVCQRWSRSLSLLFCKDLIMKTSWSLGELFFKCYDRPPNPSKALNLSYNSEETKLTSKWMGSLCVQFTKRKPLFPLNSNHSWYYWTSCEIRINSLRSKAIISISMIIQYTNIRLHTFTTCGRLQVCKFPDFECGCSASYSYRQHSKKNETSSFHFLWKLL